MTDTPDKPEDQASPEPQPDEEEPRFREVGEEELKRILAAHKKWLESDGKEGKRADLSNAHLSGANLRWANLREANFENANLSEADLHKAGLSGADLRGAHLYKANLREADLRGAKLQGAELAKATLREANLHDANLEHAKSFLGGQLAGADVSGATLPKEIAEFKALQVVEETSKNARKIFLATLLGCAYAWLTIATTTDARLLTNSASSPLPIIGTEIPIAGFYWTAPFILVGLYVYLHFYLERLWHGLAGLPARFPDGKRLDERAYPWLLNGLVRRHFELLKEGRPPIAHFEEGVTILLAWWAVPATLFAFWLRYLPRHEWAGTWLHIGLMVASVALAIIFYRSAARTLRGDERQLFSWKTFWRDRQTYQGLAVIGISVVFALVSTGAIEGSVHRDHVGRPIAKGTWTWVPWIFDRLGYRTYVNLVDAELSTKPRNWTGFGNEEELGAQIVQVKKARLGGMDLKYTNAYGAFLVKADLRRAKLQGAVLAWANLQEADLREADLRGADLGAANLHTADLSDANLQGASLLVSRMKKAHLKRAKLQNTLLAGADLQEAVLAGADLRRADFTGVKIQKILGADLTGANLSSANLSGAILRDVKLNGTQLQRANLHEADLTDAELRGTDLREAKGLTQEQLDVACGDAKTKLPDYLGDYKMRPCPKEGK